MVSTNKKGIWLCRTPNRSGKDPAWLLLLAASIGGCWGVTLLLWELVGMGRTEGFWAMGIAATVLCLLNTVLRRAGQATWFYPGFLLGCLVITLVGRPWLLEGVRLLFNSFSHTYTAVTGRVMLLLAGASDAPEARISVVVACVVLGCGVGLLPISSRSWLLAGLLCAGLVAVTGFLGSAPDFTACLLILTASILLLLSGENGADPEGNAIALRWVLCVLLGSFLVAAAMLPGVRRAGERVSETFRDKYHLWKYETQIHPLPEGDLTDFQIPKETSQPLLTVTQETPQSLYLRGFVGCSFEENRWEPVENTVLADNRELLYWLNRQEFHPAAQFGAAAALQNRQESLVTVQNHLACSEYLYVPYGIYANSCTGYLPAEDLHSDSVFARGQRNYAYSVVSGGTQDISDILTRLQNGSEERLISFRRAESAYREYVYNHYLHIPQEARKLLQEEWNRCAAGYGAIETLNSQQAQECALYFLEQYFPEEPTEENREMPLAHLEGTSYQYATVAALTLRYYGVPARYAEGFMITGEMAASAGVNGTINLTQDNAGAWVEVYQDGIGWLPMDLTPGMGQIIEERPYSSQMTEDAEQKQGTKTEEEEKQKETDRPDGGSLVMIRKVFDWTWTLLLLILPVLMAVLVLRRRYLLKCREKRFRADSCRDAVGWIFREAAKLLDRLGLDRGNGSMEELCPVARQRFGEEYAASLKAMIALNGRAVFSSRQLEEERRAEMLTFYESTLQNLKRELPWWKKVWLMWGLCLY